MCSGDIADVNDSAGRWVVGVLRAKKGIDVAVCGECFKIGCWNEMLESWDEGPEEPTWRYWDRDINGLLKSYSRLLHIQIVTSISGCASANSKAAWSANFFAAV